MEGLVESRYDDYSGYSNRNDIAYLPLPWLPRWSGRGPLFVDVYWAHVLLWNGQ